MTAVVWNGVGWVNLTTAKRWDGSVWQDLLFGRRYMGSSWVEFYTMSGGGGGPITGNWNLNETPQTGTTFNLTQDTQT